MNRDSDTLFDIVHAAGRALEVFTPLSDDEFVADWKSQAIVAFELMIVGEATKRLSPEFRNRHPKIPWQKIAGLRDIIVHQYDNINTSTVITTMRHDIPELVRYLQQLELQK